LTIFLRPSLGPFLTSFEYTLEAEMTPIVVTFCAALLYRAERRC
jgi:hypothetical protein